MAERHRDRHAPRALLEALGDVLGEPQGARGLLCAPHAQLELRLREVHVELLAQPRAARRDLQRARRLAKLGVGVIGAAVDRRDNRALDREARGVERVPRRRGARERRRELARAIEPARLAVAAEEAHGERRVDARAPAHHALDPRDDERPLVRGREPVEELRTRRHRHAVERAHGSGGRGQPLASEPRRRRGDGAGRARRPTHATKSRCADAWRRSPGRRRNGGNKGASRHRGHCSASETLRLVRASDRTKTRLR